MNRVWLFLICAVILVVGLACGGTSGTVAGAGAGGDGCPDGFTYIRAGGSFGGCRFEPGAIVLYVYCETGSEYTAYFNRLDSGPVWRSDDEPSKRGLQVFWPGGDFACAKDRCFDCE